MLRINRNLVMVRIDKKAQKEKMEQVGSIIIPPAYRYMKFFLQYGVIQQIGSYALEQFPEMEEGDTMLFHHSIEGNITNLLQTLDNGDELRCVKGDNNFTNRNFQIFGIIKPDGQLIASPIFLFLDKQIRPCRAELSSKSIFIGRQDMWRDKDRIKGLIKDLEQQEQWMAESWAHTEGRQWVSDEELRGFEDAEKAIISMRKEREMLTKALNTRSMFSSEVLHIHPQATQLTGGVKAGQRIVTDERIMYPLDYLGEQCTVIPRDHVWAVE